MADQRKSVGILVIGGIPIALGIAVVFIPFTSSVAARSVIRLILVLVGILWATAIFAFRREANPLWGTISVVLSLLAGTIVMLNSFVSEAAVPLLLAAYLLVNGVAVVLYAGRQYPRQRRWEWLGLAGALSAITSAALYQIPELMSFFMAVNLLALGLAIVGLGSRRGKMKPRRRGN